MGERAPLVELSARLNSLGLPEFEANVETGAGVFDTLKGVTRLILTELKRGTSPGNVTRSDAPTALAAVSSAERPGGILISYRREDTAGSAGRLYDALAKTFGEQAVFMDVDAIPLGSDFIDEITKWVASSDVVLVVIGSRWLTVPGKDGRPRLEDERDIHRLEIEAALARPEPVIPVLVDDARMPEASQLPASLARLIRRQGTTLRHSSFRSDVEGLARGLTKILPKRARPG